MSTQGKKPAVVQMADVAKLAGVSKSTVSRALANSPLVSQKTKDLILGIAKENNYRLNTAARNFRLKESLTVAVLLPTAQEADWRLSDPFFLELLGSIAEAVDQHGHQLLLSRMSPQPGEWIEDFIDKRTADGVILIGQGSQHEVLNHLAQDHKAISVWGAKINDYQLYPSVGTDNYLGGYRATVHLLEKNRKRILFLGYRDFPEISQRYEGYRAALAENNISYDKDLLHETGGDTHNAHATIHKVIKSGIKFDAIFAASDLLAMSAISALEANGIDVPRDVSVVGYDDISIAGYFNPPLTTIHQNRSLGGQILVSNLLEAIQGHKPEAVTLDPQLIIRESS